MSIFIDADETLATWKYIADAGGFKLYKGKAQRGDTVIRWGGNHSRYNYPEGVRVLNSHLVLSKYEQAMLFTANHVSFPTIYMTRKEWEKDGSPNIVIKPYIGQMGTGMRLVGRPDFTKQEQLWQRYIEKDHEYRAMMVKELMAFFMEKHPPTNGDFRWNEHRGAEWTRVPENRTLRNNIRRLAKQALDAIKYDFGAVDIIQKENKLYVLEVNSRPEFEKVNAERFARAIHSYLGV
jgi:glutathione synthase/RimK-type ligase-like ATP-grasp enzyme